jgi:hypothetical protein
MGHGSVIWEPHEVAAYRIIVHGIRGYYRAKIEEVGVDIFDFGPNSLENIWFHIVYAMQSTFPWESSTYTLIFRSELNPQVSHLSRAWLRSLKG